MWSPCYTRVISECFEVVHHDTALYKYWLLYFALYLLFICAINYTLWAVKTCHIFFHYNSGIPWATVTLFVPLKTGINTLQSTHLMGAWWRHNYVTLHVTEMWLWRRPWPTALRSAFDWSAAVRNFRRRWSIVCFFQFLLRIFYQYSGKKYFAFALVCNRSFIFRTQHI